MAALSLRRLMIGVRARYHLWSGLRAYRSGQIRSAGRHLDEALSCGHESFTAFLLLGKIAYRQRDVGRAVECFHRAREADPERFTVQGFPDDFLTTLSHQPQKLPRLRVRISIETSRDRPGDRSAETVPAQPPANAVLGDFSSHDELTRHKRQPAFRPGDGANVDWDAEADKLFDD